MTIKSISSKIAFLYCSLTLFMLAFVNYEGAIGLEAPIRFPHIHGQVIIWHSSIAALFFLVSILIKKTKSLFIDIPICCLLVKCFLDILPVAAGLSNISDYFAHWACTVVAFVTYFVIVESDLNQPLIEKLKTLILIFGIILSIQVFYTFLKIEVPYVLLQYKGEMLIPYGATNIIASAIVPTICICFYSQIRLKWIIIAVLLLGIVLTKSRGGMTLALVTILFLLYAGKGCSNKCFIQRFLLLILAAIGIFFLLSNEIVQLALMGFAADQDYLDVNNVSSGRTDLWSELLSEMWHINIFTGVGMKSLTGNEAGAHNLIIDLIYKCGIIGTINYGILLCYIIKRGIQQYKANNRTLLVTVCVMLLNMMYEVNYFSYACDCYFWIIAGLMMKEYYIRRSMCQKLFIQ